MNTLIIKELVVADLMRDVLNSVKPQDASTLERFRIALKSFLEAAIMSNDINTPEGARTTRLCGELLGEFDSSLDVATVRALREMAQEALSVLSILHFSEEAA